MNQFVIPVYGPDTQKRDERGNQRPNIGAAATFVFSSDYRFVLTLFGNRFKNRKVPSGGIEESDFKDSSTTIFEAAFNAALRELEEESSVRESDLTGIAKCDVEDVIRGDMMRYYFVASAKPGLKIVPFRSKEDGKEHWVDYQRWECVENMLRGASHDGDKYNTLYSIALCKIIMNLKEQGFEEDPKFKELIIDLACNGIDLEKQEAFLEELKEKEEVARRARQRY